MMTRSAISAKAATKTLRKGQAMIETVLAVLVVAFLFHVLFWLDHMLTGKILLEYGALRAARARAVGCNYDMCLKVVKIAVIPVSGEMIEPAKGDPRRKDMSEAALVRTFLGSPDGLYEHGLLDYEHWDKVDVRCDNAGRAQSSLKTDWFDLHGEAQLDSFPVYMNAGGD